MSEMASASGQASQQEMVALRLTIQGLQMQLQAAQANLHKERMVGFKQGVLSGWCAAKGIDKENVIMTADGQIKDK